MINSMTGYASGQGQFEQIRWSWELRSLNGKGLDIRLRVPDWIEGLEAGLKQLLEKAAMRGNVSLNLRVFREGAEAPFRLNSVQLYGVLEMLKEIEARAAEHGLSLAPSSAVDILTQRAVLEQNTDYKDTGSLRAALLQDVQGVIGAFADMRAAEGRVLAGVLAGQIDKMEALTSSVATILPQRQEQAARIFRRNLDKIMGVLDIDEARVAQELAVLAVKSDVTEEIDRLRAHIKAARDLLAGGGAIGRKLDFLMQEFNREANTLCSKSQMVELTEIGLALKVTIDQMREQVQNVE
jgi:uncharacterized protein (TIGR00255 family)